jgi:hypothetical protein
MKPLEKIELISQIGRELQSRMTYSDIDQYFTALGVKSKPKTDTYNSKWVYVKEILGAETEDMVLKIADELKINHNYTIGQYSESEADFWRPNHFRLFMSHLSSFKTTVHLLRDSLLKYGVSAFVAHDDIEPTREWQDEIEKALFSMDALAAILMPGFNESKWTDQEVGIAIGRQKLVIPIRKGLDPYGFIGKYQGFNPNGKSVENVAEFIIEILVSHKLTRKRMIESLSNLLMTGAPSAMTLNYLKVLQKSDDIAIDILHKLNAQPQTLLALEALQPIKKVLDELFQKHKIPKGKPEHADITDDSIPF